MDGEAEADPKNLRGQHGDECGMGAVVSMDMSDPLAAHRLRNFDSPRKHREAFYQELRRPAISKNCPREQVKIQTRVTAQQPGGSAKRCRCKRLPYSY